MRAVQESTPAAVLCVGYAYCAPGYFCGQTLNGGLRVRNRDGSGETRLDEDGGANSEPDWGVADPGTPSPPPDTTPPDTAITSGPSGPTNDTTPTFAFTGSDNASPAAAAAVRVRGRRRRLVAVHR